MPPMSICSASGKFWRITSSRDPVEAAPKAKPADALCVRSPTCCVPTYPQMGAPELAGWMVNSPPPRAADTSSTVHSAQGSVRLTGLAPGDVSGLADLRGLPDGDADGDSAARTG